PHAGGPRRGRHRCRLSVSPRTSRPQLVDRQVALHLAPALLHHGDVLRELRQQDGALEPGDEEVRDRLRAAVATDVAAATGLVERGVVVAVDVNEAAVGLENRLARRPPDLGLRADGNLYQLVGTYPTLNGPSRQFLGESDAVSGG